MAEQVECVVQANNILGEVPLWCPRAQKLWWIDIYAPSLHCFDPGNGEHKFVPLPGKIVGSFGLRASGGLVIARNDGFFSFDPANSACLPLACPEPDKPSTASTTANATVAAATGSARCTRPSASHEARSTASTRTTACTRCPTASSCRIPSRSALTTARSILPTH
jgi:sugar lactone lactonase YvrE